MKPEKIGKYESVRRIGEGSTGTVYKAFDPIVDRFVALKVIPGEKVSKPEPLQRFKKEVRAQGRLIHPNVALLFDVEYIAGEYIIVMEYVEGRSLREVMREEKIFTLQAFYTLIGQVCLGLACAHRQGVVHRDIKPENLRLTPEKRIKILDFSIAKIQSATATATGMNFLLGSAHYMAPEQIMGMAVTPATDQFAVGVISYEMLTSRRPFESGSLADSILNATRMEPPPIQDCNPMVDPELGAIIARTLRKEPHQRHPSIQHYQRALRDYFRKIDLVLPDLEDLDD
jgi:serine/threonine protein kinase